MLKGEKDSVGKPCNGRTALRYLHNPKDRQKWIVDDEAAFIVKRIFQSVIAGKNIVTIEEELTAEQILTPNIHWRAIGEKKSHGAHNTDPCKWSSNTIINILKKEEYMGWKILNKTGTDSYKSKKRKPTPENRIVFKYAHQQIIDEETWNIVQRLQGTKGRIYKLDGETNPLTGILYCADCGAKMFHKRRNTGRPDQQHHEGELQEAWAETCNRVLEQNGHTERIDHRNYERQGIDQISTVHLDVTAFQMEKHGIRTERGNRNREIEVTNQRLRQLKACISKLRSWLKEETANDIEDFARLKEKVMFMFDKQHSIAEKLKPIDRRLKVLDEHISNAEKYFQY